MSDDLAARIERGMMVEPTPRNVLAIIGYAALFVLIVLAVLDYALHVMLVLVEGMAL